MSAATGQATGLKGTGYKQVTTPTLSPEQMNLFKNILGGASPGIGSGLQHLSGMASGDQSYFDQLEAPALRQFGQLQGQLASRFSGMGSGARKSSGFNLSSNAAAQELAENLQSQRLGYQQQAIRELLGLGQNLLGQRTFETALTPKKTPFWQELLSSLGGGVGMAGGSIGSLYALKKLGLMG